MICNQSFVLEETSKNQKNRGPAPIVRIPEWRVRAGGAQWPVMPSKGDAGRCRGVYVAHKSDTARDASRRERNFLIGKSCESPRLKGALFIKACSSNRLAQRWARARAEHVSCGSWGWSNGKQSFMLSQDGKVWETKDRARTKIDVRKVPGWDLPFPGWRRKRGRRSPRTVSIFQDGSPLRRQPRSPMRIKAAGCYYVRYNTGVPCLMLCPQGWGAHDNLQFPSQPESEDQRAGAN